MTNLDSILKCRDITLPTTVHIVKVMVFPLGPVQMWELDHREGWVPNNWCLWMVLLEKTLESPLDCKEIQPVHPKGDQSWVFTGRTNAEVETPKLWPPHAKNWHTGKTLMLEKIKGVRRRGWQRMRWLDGITKSWTWVWIHSGSWWRTGRPGVLQSMGLQRVGHDWVTELNWCNLYYHDYYFYSGPT